MGIKKVVLTGAVLLGAAFLAGCKQTGAIPDGPEPTLKRPPVKPLRLVQTSRDGMTPPGASATTPTPQTDFPQQAGKVKKDWRAPRLNESRRAKALDVFQEKCAPCHGEKAKGDGPMVDRLPEGAPDLNAAKTQGLSDAELLWVITHGRLDQGKMMPGFVTLDENTRRSLVSLIRWFAQQADEKSAPAPDRKKTGEK